MALDTKTHTAIAALAALPLGGEAGYEGELIRKVLLTGTAIAEMGLGRCTLCPLFSVTENDDRGEGKGDGDLCDQYYTAERVRACAPEGADAELGHALVPAALVPRFAVKGWLA